MSKKHLTTSFVHENSPHHEYDFEFEQEGEATNKMTYSNIKFSDLYVNTSPSPIRPMISQDKEPEMQNEEKETLENKIKRK